MIHPSRLDINNDTTLGASMNSTFTQFATNIGFERTVRLEAFPDHLYYVVVFSNTLLARNHTRKFLGGNTGRTHISKHITHHFSGSRHVSQLAAGMYPLILKRISQGSLRGPKPARGSTVILIMVMTCRL